MPFAWSISRSNTTVLPGHARLEGPLYVGLELLEVTPEVFKGTVGGVGLERMVDATRYKLVEVTSRVAFTAYPALATMDTYGDTFAGYALITAAAMNTDAPASTLNAPLAPAAMDALASGRRRGALHVALKALLLGTAATLDLEPVDS